MKAVIFLAMLGARACFGQFCIVDSQPNSSDGFSYVRQELRALDWLRMGALDAKKIQSPLDAPKADRFHKLVEFHSRKELIESRYNCALRILGAYEKSGRDDVQASVDIYRSSIEGIKTINQMLSDLTDSIYKAEKPTDIDQVEIAKMLASAKAMQKDAATLALAAAKMSTFALFKMEGAGNDEHPVGFGITDAQRKLLLAEAEDLAKREKTGL